MNIDECNYNIKNLRNYYEIQVEKNIPKIKINGHRSKRLPGNSNISFKSIDGEDLLLNLDMYGICASTGSACSSGSSTPSHVVTAIGNDEDVARSSLRITIGKENTKDDIDYLVESLIKIVKKLRDMNNKRD